MPALSDDQDVPPQEAQEIVTRLREALPIA
jgi:hypothetical protein